MIDREASMSEAKRQQLLGLGDSIARYIVDLHPGAQFTHGFKDPLMYELLPTIDGVEYKIRISVITDREKGEVAKARYDKLRQDLEWGKKAIEKGSPENMEWKQLTEAMARGGVH
jgi:hypothetical protein